MAFGKELRKIVGVDSPFTGVGAFAGAGLFASAKAFGEQHKVDLINHFPVVKVLDGEHLVTFSDIGSSTYPEVLAAGGLELALISVATLLVRRFFVSRSA